MRRVPHAGSGGLRRSRRAHEPRYDRNRQLDAFRLTPPQQGDSTMPNRVFTLALLASLLLPGAAAAADEAHPIDCPLHKGGVDPRGMRPYAETEKWIEYLDKPERAAWQKPDEVVRALGLR